MDKIWEFFKDLYTMPLGSMESWRFLVLLVVTVALGFLAYYLVRLLLKILGFIFTIFANIFSSKRRCKTIQCPHCGRTLDKCVCSENKKRGYTSRLYHYKKEARQLKKNKK